MKLSKKQTQLLEILSDGECHAFRDVLKKMDYLDDEQYSMFVHVSSLRKLLRPLRQTIVLELMPSGANGYRHVLLVDEKILSGLKNGQTAETPIATASATL